MPGALKEADKLDQGSIPAYQQVGRHLNTLDGLEIRVRRVVKPIAEKVFYFGAAKLARGQTDVVDDQKGNGGLLRAGPEVRRGAPASTGNTSGFPKRFYIGTGIGEAFGKNV